MQTPELMRVSKWGLLYLRVLCVRVCVCVRERERQKVRTECERSHIIHLNVLMYVTLEWGFSCLEDRLWKKCQHKLGNVLNSAIEKYVEPLHFHHMPSHLHIANGAMAEGGEGDTGLWVEQTLVDVSTESNRDKTKNTVCTTASHPWPWVGLRCSSNMRFKWYSKSDGNVMWE